MPQYTYACPTCGPRLITQKMQDASEKLECIFCHEMMERDYRTDLTGVPVHYHSQGFHCTDYSRYGDKKELLNKNWEKMTGEKAPKPDSTIPRNSGEKH